MKLSELLEEFDGLDPEESLQTLIEMSQDLPELSPARAAEREDTRRLVKECQTPVYLWVDVVDGHVQLEAYVTERSPTVRGYVSLLVEGISGASITEVARTSRGFAGPLGLAGTLGMTRRRGFTGLCGGSSEKSPSRPPETAFRHELTVMIRRSVAMRFVICISAVPVAGEAEENRRKFVIFFLTRPPLVSLYKGRSTFHWLSASLTDVFEWSQPIRIGRRTEQ